MAGTQDELSRFQPLILEGHFSLAGSPMRTFVAAPKAEGKYPGIWC
jgi:hypothetical protein